MAHRNRRPPWRGRGLLVAAVALVVLALVGQARAAGPVHRILLIMDEFRYEPNVLHLKVGEEVVLTIRNTGVAEHEWSVGQGVENNPDGKGYQKDLLAILNPEVTGRKYQLEKASAKTTVEDAAEGEYVRMISTELDVEPGGEATLRFTVPASAKGEWEMGCFIPGHYESGMSGLLEIE